MARCVAILRYYAGEAVREVGEVIPAQAAGALQFTLREPLGVVALITPWNFPLAIPLWKTAPALAFGNTVVLKPAEMSSHVAALLAETAVGVAASGRVQRRARIRTPRWAKRLLRAPEVSAISFTGSGRVGARVAAIAAERNIRYQTEMGGKNVAIVLPDADLAQAASLTAAGAMRYAGQKCTATSRVVVAHDVEGPFLAELRRQIDALVLGPVTAPNAAVGPVISEHARDSIRRTLDATDAERVYEGASPTRPISRTDGSLPPTVLRGAATDSELAQRELFGPVLAMFPADDLDHAIALANDTRVWTERLALHARHSQRAALRATHRGRPRARQRRHDRRRSARAVRRHEGLELRQSRAGLGGARVLHRDQDGSDQPVRRVVPSRQARDDGGSMTAYVTLPETALDASTVPATIRVIDSHTEGEPTRVVDRRLAAARWRDDGRAPRRPPRALRPSAARRRVRAARTRRDRRRAAHAARHERVRLPASSSSTTGRTSACAATGSLASSARSSTSGALGRASRGSTRRSAR